MPKKAVYLQETCVTWNLMNMMTDGIARKGWHTLELGRWEDV